MTIKLQLPLLAYFASVSAAAAALPGLQEFLVEPGAFSPRLFFLLHHNLRISVLSSGGFGKQTTNNFADLIGFLSFHFCEKLSDTAWQHDASWWQPMRFDMRD